MLAAATASSVVKKKKKKKKVLLRSPNPGHEGNQAQPEGLGAISPQILSSAEGSTLLLSTPGLTGREELLSWLLLPLLLLLLLQPSSLLLREAVPLLLLLLQHAHRLTAHHSDKGRRSTPLPRLASCLRHDDGLLGTPSSPDTVIYENYLFSTPPNYYTSHSSALTSSTILAANINNTALPPPTPRGKEERPPHGMQGKKHPTTTVAVAAAVVAACHGHGHGPGGASWAAASPSRPGAGGLAAAVRSTLGTVAL